MHPPRFAALPAAPRQIKRVFAAACGRSPPAAGCCGPPERSLPPRAVPATGFRRAPLAHALPVLTATALRHVHRAHAACIAAQHAPCRCDVRSPCDSRTRPRYAPCSRFSRRRLPLGCARGTCLSSPQPSREPQRYAPSSPPARKWASVRCGRRIVLVPSFASPREVHPKVRCQPSSRRTGQRGLRPGCPRLMRGCQHR